MAGIRLIVGLGNPGKEHEATRHNAGFWLLERFAALQRVVLKSDRKFFGRIAALQGAFLLEPQTYMNVSGKAVAALANFYKIAPEEILVAHDELDFEPGACKLKLGGGVAGHNGLKDIAARLATHGFWRLRIGIGHPGDRDAVVDYVLQKPSQADRKAMLDALERALEVLPLTLAGDMQGAMLKLHTRSAP